MFNTKNIRFEHIKKNLYIKQIAKKKKFCKRNLSFCYEYISNNNKLRFNNLDV